ncbi:excitatory amino acid transporter 1-like isoform X3 [Osmerus eperlanus]|uniref:excitatory amino acid transporter 1-like isoform X3 n=1 Tax=Osmerus eperlanus TaxID=29151 RepID=UPI002E15D43A
MTEMPPSSNGSSVKRKFQEPQTTGQTQGPLGPQGRSLPVHVKTFLKNNAFVGITVTAVVIGVVLGFALRSSLTSRQIRYFSFPGEMLMRMLQMLVMPLLVSSLVTGISSLDSKATGRMGVQALLYYMVTTIIAVFTGIVVVVLIQPGKGTKDTPSPFSGRIEVVQTLDAFLDLVRNMFPSNLVEACFKQYKTVYIKKTTASVANVLEADGTLRSGTSGHPMDGMMPKDGSSNGVNALGLVVFSISLGLVLGSMKTQGQPLRDFFNCLNEVILRLVGIIIWYAPVGILFLIAGKIVEMGDIGQIGGQLAMYTLCVISGLLVHSLLVLPLLYFLATHRNPYLFIGGLLQALLTALGTSSSSATLPITFRCLEENNGMDKRVTRFMLPVGATINMDGTALYEAVAAIFIAQVNHIDLNLGQIITISITATAASIGAAGIPQAGLVTMMIVLTSAGLPTEDITLIVAVDWFLDRLRTTTNVLGDCLGVGIVAHLSRHELQNTTSTEGDTVVEGGSGNSLHPKQTHNDTYIHLNTHNGKRESSV